MKFSFFVPMFNLWPQGQASFDPRGILLTNLVEVHKEMPHTKYQISMPSGFREEEFWRWASLFLCSNLWPPGRGQFWPQRHHMDKLGRGPQGDGIYQISNLYAFQFQRRRILKFSFSVPMFQLVTPGRGQFWPLGHHMNKLGRGPLEDATYQISKL